MDREIQFNLDAKLNLSKFNISFFLRKKNTNILKSKRKKKYKKMHIMSK